MPVATRRAAPRIVWHPGSRTSSIVEWADVAKRHLLTISTGPGGLVAKWLDKTTREGAEQGGFRDVDSARAWLAEHLAGIKVRAPSRSGASS